MKNLVFVDESIKFKTLNSTKVDKTTTETKKRRKQKDRNEKTSTKRKCTEKELKITLQEGIFEFIPKYKDFDEISKELQNSARDQWVVFTKSARSKINKELQIRNISKIDHMTIGCIDPHYFYLFFHDQPGAIYFKWYEDIIWNDIEKREDCIQFRFSNGSYPVFDDFKD